MKKSNLLLFLYLFIFGTPIHAQKVIDLQGIDYVYCDNRNESSLLFLTKNGSNYDVTTIAVAWSVDKLSPVYGNSDNPEDSSFKEYAELHSFKENNVRLEIDPEEFYSVEKELKPFTPEQFTEMLQAKAYVSFYGDRRRQVIASVNQNILAMLHSKQNEDYTCYVSNESDVMWDNSPVNLMQCVYVKVAPDKHIMLAFGRYGKTGFILPSIHEDEVKASIDGSDYELGEHSRDSMEINQCRKDMFGASGLADLYTKEPANSSPEKYNLTFALQRDLLPQPYDSIFYHQNTVMCYTKQSKTWDIYNPFLEKLNIQPVRSIDLDNKYLIQIIEGNEIFFIKNSVREKEIRNEVVAVSSTSDFTNWKILKISGKFSLEAKLANKKIKKTYSLIGGAGITDLRFLNNGNGCSTSKDHITPLPENWLMLKKGNKYGISSYQLSEKNLTFTLHEELPLVCDSIQLDNYYYPMRFYKDGLSGMFPKMKEAKYTEINNFEGAFARFVLPSGITGWLNVFRNEEYPDELD